MCLNAPLKPTQHFDAEKRECISVSFCSFFSQEATANIRTLCFDQVCHDLLDIYLV